ncbi:hypothetical protein BRC71_11310 [Halobacteriales archaeon QH_7_65_31]|nr:MAG: hypothetical protein BRC71_11310 [Halobacteriales archaeon QH_7_65_31]PSQ29713.1 MAG: hypothetical protein BRD16_10015 [Halobacteriales archaeon SW_6_65_46]
MRLEIETGDDTSVTDITDTVSQSVPTGRNGTVSVFVPHTTAGVVINETEERLVSDISRFVGRMVPDADWYHDRIDDNTRAHLASMVLGREVTVPVTDGTLDIGQYQSILLVDCDGPRTRAVDVV